MHTLTEKILKDLGSALKRFGTYSFDDKGAREVMHTSDIVNKLKELGPKDAGLVLLEISQSPLYDGRGEQLAQELICSMDDWDK